MILGRKIWGPYAWHLLHTFSINNNFKISESKKHQYYIFYTSFAYVLPCMICRDHYYDIIYNKLKLNEKDINRQYLKRWIFDVHNIVKIQFEQISKRLAEQHFTISATDEAIDWLAQLGYDPQYGARPVKRVLQKQVLNELSKQILADKVDQTKEIIVDVFDKQIVFRN